MKNGAHAAFAAGDVDIAALANEIVRLRAAAADAQAKAEHAAQKAKEAAAQLKAANARLLEALRGPRKPPSAGAPARSGARWPLNPRAKTLRKILMEMDEIGVMTPAELSKALPEIPVGSLYAALKVLRREGMIERLGDGSYGLTEAQQALMRAAANGAD